ncbi:MAG TPA: TonB-dependent receptor [Usitatibacter sp.]|nr:TonB-dependent receptor [Usitatibacter sp.]
MKHTCAFLAAALACASSYAQVVPSVPLDTVVVSATRAEQAVFDAPAAVNAVGADVIGIAGPQVNLSEALSRIPGIAALDRQNYAQDLQMSIRGFGSRSTFGIRGIRLIVDGIPATMPDGQGQASAVSLSSAERIEVLRGPLALLYGNAAGGVVQVFTRSGASQPTLQAGFAAGSYGMRRGDVQYAATAGSHAFTLDASRFDTDGYREHSAATREIANAKWAWQADPRTRVVATVNVFDQPKAQDPLGLTRAQWEQDPRQTQPIAIQNDTRKSVRQDQAGSVIEHRLGEDTTVSGRIYYGQRHLDNALGVPLGAQLAPTSSGGIVVFDRDYEGAGLQLAHRFAWGDAASARLVAGLTYDRMHDDRQGYVNRNGERGALKRNEDDYVSSTDALLQASADFGPAWSALAGVRATRVRFDSHDHYVAPGNPDDSGSVEYRGTNPVAGVTWHATPRLNVYANAGRGFETPTFTELAYRNAASGLNTDLQASRSRHLEIGAKWRGRGHGIELAVYDIRTDDELVVDVNTGGRSTFRNAGRTKRQGIELSHWAQWTPEWTSRLALTLLDARFDEGFLSGAGSSAVAVAAGNRLPGTPDRSAYAELAYAPRWGWSGLHAAVELVYAGRLYVDDLNSDSTDPATVLNLRIGFKYHRGALDIEPLARLENVTDRRYVGSVIVNEANRRFFESAPGRHWMVGVTGRYRF